jgi:hypothetical protein
MKSKSQTLILVHGAYHCAWCWKHVLMPEELTNMLHGLT